MSVRENFYNFLDRNKPNLNKIQYCGFDLYFGRRSGIVNRIRFGHLTRVYEELLCNSIVADLKKTTNPVFIDIGANIGFISLYILSKLPDSKIYAFEPGPSQHKLLGITLFANKLEQNIILSNQAVGDSDEPREFYVHKDEFESGADGILDTERGGETEKIFVPGVTLDSWWKRNESVHIDVIKMDTEGAELLILKGAEGIINALKPVLYLEISPLNLKKYPFKAIDILEWLNKHNYRVVTLGGVVVNAENINSLALTEDSFVARPN